MKRRRDSEHEISSINEAITLPNDIWKFIFKFGFDGFLSFARSSRHNYEKFGGLKNVFQIAVALNERAVLSKGAQTVLPLDMIFHPLKWQMVTQGLIPSLHQVISNENRRRMQSLPLTSTYIIAGGYARSFLISAFRNCLYPNLVVCPFLDASTNDIDCFYEEKSEPPTDFMHPAYQTQYIEVLKESGLAMACKPEAKFGSIIRAFDFTCTQVALTFQGVLVTPAFVFSLLTGGMYLSYCERLCVPGKSAWPFSNLDSFYLLDEERSVAVGAIVTFLHKKMFYDRACKYIGKGYTDIMITKMQFDVMKTVIQTDFEPFEDKRQKDKDEEYKKQFDFVKFVVP